MKPRSYLPLLISGLLILVSACGQSPAATGAVIGVVVDENGEPIPGALVNFYRSDLLENSGTQQSLSTSMYLTSTDGDGWYSYAEAPLGVYNIVVTTSDRTGVIFGVEVQTGATVRAPPVKPGATGSISGTAVLAGESEHEGIVVFIPGTSFVARTSFLGDFEISSVPAGTFRVVAEAAGYGPTAVDDVTVEVAGNTVLNMSLSRHPASPPAIHSLSAIFLARGQVLTIEGADFGATRGDSKVRFGDVEAVEYEYWSDSQIKVILPFATPLGTATVAVQVGGNVAGYRPLVVLRGVSIAAGWAHSMAVRADGTVEAWGGDGIGESTVPSDLADVVSVATATFHSVALKSNGEVVAWGNNISGQSAVPPDLSNVVAIGAGWYMTFAVKSDGTVIAWGVSNFVPPDLSGVVAATGGGEHQLFLKSDGTVLGRGGNTYGQRTVPAFLSNVRAIAAGENHSLALRLDGTVVAWGRNVEGQSSVPAGLSSVVAVAAGGNHSLAVTSEGSVVAWGSNSSGQIDVPMDLSDVIAVAAGIEHSLALRSDGTLVAWGKDLAGQSTVPSDLAVLVP